MDSFDAGGVSMWVVAGGARQRDVPWGRSLYCSCFTLSAFFMFSIFLFIILLCLRCAVTNIVRALGTKVHAT